MPRDKAHTIGGLPIKPKGTRARTRWERHRAVWELHEQGVNKLQISKRLGVPRPIVYELLRAGPPDPNELPPGESILPPRLRVTAVDEAQQLVEPSYVPDTTETPEGSIGFLKTVQADTRVPITERIKCAIAVARLETAKEASTWTPPTDPTLWAEAMVDAFKASSPEARAHVSKLLARPVSEDKPV